MVRKTRKHIKTKRYNKKGGGKKTNHRKSNKPTRAKKRTSSKKRNSPNNLLPTGLRTPTKNNKSSPLNKIQVPLMSPGMMVMSPMITPANKATYGLKHHSSPNGPKEGNYNRMIETYGYRANGMYADENAPTVVRSDPSHGNGVHAGPGLLLNHHKRIQKQKRRAAAARKLRVDSSPAKTESTVVLSNRSRLPENLTLNNFSTTSTVPYSIASVPPTEQYTPVKSSNVPRNNNSNKGSVASVASTLLYTPVSNINNVPRNYNNNNK